MLSISPSWRNYLQGQPEYGMGYQKALIKLSSGIYESGYIFNSSTFIKTEELSRLTASQLWLTEFTLRQQSGCAAIVDITITPRPPETLKGVRRVSVQFSGSLQTFNTLENANLIRASQAAKDAPITSTTTGEVFKRFSAYVDDFRVTTKKGLMPGTFATTAEDAENVKTGSDAVKRYALENKQSANKRFTINPITYTKLQKGITQPAYGEPGGGVEVIFVDGTADNTVSGPETIPE